MSSARRQNLATIFVAATVLLDAMAVGVVIPIVPALIVRLMGSNADAGMTNGLLLALVAGVQFVAAPFLGALSDCFGRRPILLASTAGLACDYAIMATAQNVAWLYIGRLVAGLSSATASTVNAYIADTTPPAERARIFGLMGAAASSGGVIGQLLGGALAGVSLRAPFWIAGALTTVAFVYGALILPESLGRNRRTVFKWRCANPVNAVAWLFSRRELRSLTTIYLLASGTNAVFSVIVVLYVQYRYHWSLGRTGTMLAISSLLDIIAQSLVVDLLIKHFGERLTLVSGLLAGSVGYGCMALSDSGALFTLALAPLSLLMIVAPAVQASMTRCVSESDQGQLQGSVASITSVAMALTPLIFGIVYSTTAKGPVGEAQPGEAFLVAALILLATAIGTAATEARMPDID